MVVRLVHRVYRFQCVNPAIPPLANSSISYSSHCLLRLSIMANGPALRTKQTVPLRRSLNCRSQPPSKRDFSLTSVFADLNEQLLRSRKHLEQAMNRRQVLEFQLQQTASELSLLHEQKTERDQTLALLHKSLRISFNDVPPRTARSGNTGLESSLERFKDKLRTYLGRLQPPGTIR